MKENRGIIYLLDEDVEHQSQIRTVAHALDLRFEMIRDVSQLTSSLVASQPSCLIVSDDALAQAEQMRGRTITDLHSFTSGGRLNLAGRGMATIVISQQPDVQKIVGYMRAGALNVLPTPLVDESLSHWIFEAIEADQMRVLEEERLERMRCVYNALSQRKRVVLQHMIDGRASKWSAHELDMSRRTIELDRAEILNAFGVKNAIELATLMTETKCLPLHFSHSLIAQNQALAMAK